MATFLYKVGRSAYLHRWRFIAVWLLLILGAGGVAQQMNEQYVGQGAPQEQIDANIAAGLPLLTGVIGIDFLTAMAFSAAATVFIVVRVAVTLLPAILGAVGTKVVAARAPFVKAPDPEDVKPTMGLKWVRMIRARPVAFRLGGVIVLALAAIPATQLRLAMPSDGSAAPVTPHRIAYEMIDDAFGPGRNAPTVALVEAGDSADVDPAQLPMIHGQAAAHIQGIDGVTNAQVIGISEDGAAAQVLITPEVGATDPRTAEVLENIRAGEASFEEESPSTYSVTGVPPSSRTSPSGCPTFWSPTSPSSWCWRSCCSWSCSAPFGCPSSRRWASDCRSRRR